MEPSEAQSLFDYDRWATQKQLDVVKTLSVEQYERELGSSYGGIRGTLVHIYGAQLIWYSRWKGTSPTSLAAVSEVPTFGVLREKWQRLQKDIQQYVSGLTEETLNASLPYNDLKGNLNKQPLAHLIRHLINHSTYHRGQITMMMRQLDVAPPSSIDLITYYRELNPESLVVR